MKKYYLLLSLLLLYSDVFAQNGWFSQDNSLGGKQVFFVNSNIGWILGYGNNMYKTSDGGQTWDSLYIDIELQSYYSITSVFFLNSEIGWAVGYPELVLKSDDGGIHWNILHKKEGLVSYTYFSVCFANENIGWAIICDSGGYGWIIKTNNGGEDWTLQKELKTPNLADSWQFSIGSICCIDTNTAWLVKGFEWESFDPYDPDPDILYNSIFLRTVDGGVTWMEAQSSTNIDIPQSVDFVDADKGLAVGRHGTLYKTIDGGVTWDSRETNLTGLSSVDFVDQNTGYAVGIDGLIIKTIDSGDNWEKQISGTSDHLTSICFTNADTGWAISSDEILHTTSGGNLDGPVHEKWTKIDTLNGGSDVFFVDDDYGWIIKGWYLFKTTDGGETWSSIKLDLQEYVIINSIFFIDREIGWGVGYKYDYQTSEVKGSILKFTDGGMYVKEIENDTLFQNFKFYSVCFANENIGWAVGSDSYVECGILIKTVDGGNTWFKQNHLYNLPLYSVCCQDTNIAWAAGGVHFYEYPTRLFLRTVDGGRNWTANCKDYSPVLRSVDFISAQKGWAVGSNAIFNTSDSGKTWTSTNSGIKFDLWDIDFVDEDNGWAVGDNGIILKYNGIYWTEQTSNTFSDLSSVFAVDSHEGWIVGSDVVLHTTGKEYIHVDHFTKYQDVKQFIFFQNYPNPFNNTTIIKFALPKITDVKLIIYDIMGREVITLINGEQAAGYNHIQWDGKDKNDLSVSSGMYICQLQTYEFKQIMKILLMK